MRQKVGIERTFLCATRFWAHGPPGRTRYQGTVPTLLKGVRNVVRKQGYTGPQVEKAVRKLARQGFIELGGKHSGKTVRLTDKGGRVGCGTVKLAPWTNDEYPGAALRGVKRKKRSR